MSVDQNKMAGPWITDLERDIVDEMMRNGWDNYDYVEKFESEFASWHEREFSLMTPCCTHAIHLLLLALVNRGVKENEVVIGNPARVLRKNEHVYNLDDFLE